MKKSIKDGESPILQSIHEINFHSTRLAVLGREAMKVLETLRNEGMPMEVHDPLFLGISLGFYSHASA